MLEWKLTKANKIPGVLKLAYIAMRPRVSWLQIGARPPATTRLIWIWPSHNITWTCRQHYARSENCVGEICQKDAVVWFIIIDDFIFLEQQHTAYIKQMVVLTHQIGGYYFHFMEKYDIGNSFSHRCFFIQSYWTSRERLFYRPFRMPDFLSVCLCAAFLTNVKPPCTI